MKSSAHSEPPSQEQQKSLYTNGINPRKRLLLLICIMMLTVAATLSFSIIFLYITALDEEKQRLAETAKSQAELINAIAAFDSLYSHDYPYGSRAATLAQIRQAHTRYTGFGQTGEFTLAERIDDSIVFLLNHRHYDLDNLQPVPWNSRIAEPMRLALSGKSGIITALDYRGEIVVAAYEPVRELNMGIVAKIDLAEIQAPFVKAGIIAAVFAVILTAVGAYIFIHITQPIILKLAKTITSLQSTLSELKVLRGILPICSFCKKIRDDAGYWNQVETYIQKHSDADFSHSICPSCVNKHYPHIAEEVHRKNKMHSSKKESD